MTSLVWLRLPQITKINNNRKWKFHNQICPSNLKPNNPQKVSSARQMDKMVFSNLIERKIMPRVILMINLKFWMLNWIISQIKNTNQENNKNLKSIKLEMFKLTISTLPTLKGMFFLDTNYLAYPLSSKCLKIQNSDNKQKQKWSKDWSHLILTL